MFVKLTYPNFDQSEFVDGAKQSFEQVNTLMNSGQVDELERMVSPKILRQVRSFHKERAESGMFSPPAGLQRVLTLDSPRFLLLQQPLRVMAWQIRPATRISAQRRCSGILKSSSSARSCQLD
jgi:hypothetical protein